MKSEILEQRVRARLDSLTKPTGSLGRLEEIALRFALIRGEEMPSPARKAVYVFCADHGVVSQGVSPYPSEVTRQMVQNFVDGGAAINVLCRRVDARAVIVDVGVRGAAVPGTLNRKIAEGTEDFGRQPAMTIEQAERSLSIGRDFARQAAENCDLVGLGEMGIGNTTAAAAVLSACTGLHPSETVGAGTGATSEILERKIEVIRNALKLHRPDPTNGVELLASVGGFEIGAIAGFLLAASRMRLPVVLDGFPCCAGAMIARAIRPDALDTSFFAHLSAERGHATMLKALGVEPLFDLGMRLGEGTGAALGMGLIDASVRLYREMATFDEARVSGAKDVKSEATIA